MTIEVHGLTSGEKVTIDFRGKRVCKASAVANSKGDYTVKVSAGWSWGYHTITATGASAGRHGSTRIDVVRRT